MESAFSYPAVLLLSDVLIYTPDYKVILGFIALAVLLIMSGLMSGSEVAYFSLSPDDLERFKSNKGKKARTTLKLHKDPERLLSTILAANNTVNIAIVLLAALISTKLFDFGANPVAGFIIEVVVITFMLLLFGEIIPKVYAAGHSASFALFMARPLNFITKIFYPVTSLLIISTSFVRKRGRMRKTNISMDDISDALELTSEDLTDDEKILRGIVNFGNINVSAIMCPRIDVTAIEIQSGFRSIIPVIIESGFSRIPVYSESFDNVRGILYAKDVLPYMNNSDSFKWQSLLKTPYFVPETKKINVLLKEFQVKKIHMAVVIDEYGGTAGIVTLEDILEEIVGEITDETDDDEELFRKIDERTYVFEGKILLNDFIKVLNLEDDLFDAVRGESETLAGLILELTGEIPGKDQVIKFREYSFVIESADRRRIRQVRVSIDEAQDEKSEE